MSLQQDVTYLRVEASTPSDIEKAICNLRGKQMYAEKISIDNGINYKTIVLKAFDNGFYLLEIKVGEELIRTKLIKNDQ